MSIMVVGSLSGAPGATTVALALAACWQDAVVVEADWQGGRIAARFGLHRDPGVVTFAAARDSGELERHTQVLPSGLPVLVGPEDSDVAAPFWMSAGAAVGHRLSLTPREVVVDGGRLTSSSPVAVHVVPQARRVLVVARNEPAELATAAGGLARLRTICPSAVLVVVGEAPYGRDELTRALGGPAIVLPWDRAAAGAVSAGLAHRNLRATPWARAVRSLAETLALSVEGAANAEVAVGAR